MLRLIIFFGLCLASLMSYAQSNRVLYNSSDFEIASTDSTIVSIKMNSLSPFITVRYEGGKTKDVLKKDIWGIVRNGKPYRYYAKSFLEIVRRGDVIEYTSVSPYLLGNPGIVLPERSFSKTLDSKIYDTPKKF